YNDETAQARRAAADAYIDANLADPALAPAAVAAGVFVSLRHLHRLYAMTGTTVTERIRHARMQRCQDDLCNPAFAAVPVSAIGARWGMPDAAHFSRAFSAHFDCPPAAYRRRHLG
ncbi:MAG: helix-turn-helix domain-containing protein, partial [Mycobacteriaceae bacterium]|nr:helix-turn-helix domain-containing protein [Mycobacteriaceae bacterium]